VYYGNHIAREDEIVLPRAVALLEPEDWTAVARAVASKPDPLFGENPEQRYRALRRHIASHNT
jgi:hemerythrin-like domain-containing protein